MRTIKDNREYKYKLTLEFTFETEEEAQNVAQQVTNNQTIDTVWNKVESKGIKRVRK